MNVVSFSGGKDSTAMLFMMLERNIRVDRIICVDTTKEFPAMYQHIEKVQSVCPIEIEVVKIDFDYWFGEHIKIRGKNKGKRGYGWPNFRIRWCTSLKKHAFLCQFYNYKYNPRKLACIKNKDLEIIEYHGIAYDEKGRCKKNKGRDIKYPLVDWEITEKQALKYCYSKGFDWNGLYEKFYRVSCWCCPLARISGLRALYNDFPELWQELIKMDKKSLYRFRSDYSIQDLSKRFANENLFKEI